MRRFAARHVYLFRAVLAMALLAWTSLTLGAVASPSMPGSTAQAHAAMASATVDCGAMAMADAMRTGHAQVPAAPATPACCHGGCHCLAACIVMLGVPHRMACVPTPAALPPAAWPRVVASIPAAPPLRPPIA